MLALATLNNLGAQLARCTLVVEVDTHKTLFPLLEVAHDAAPLTLALHGEGVLVVGRSVGLKAEYLNAGTRRLVHNDTRANNLRVVEDEQRALRQLLGQRVKMALAYLAIAVYEQLRVAAILQRKLRNALVGQGIIKIVYIYVTFHIHHYCCRKVTK